MKQFGIRTENFNRIMNGPLKVICIGYLPRNVYTYKGPHPGVNFCFILSGEEKQVTLRADKKEFTAEIPCLLLNCPGVHYEIVNPFGWEELYFAYDKKLLTDFERFKVNFEVPLKSIQISTEMSSMINNIFDYSEKIHNYGIIDRLDYTSISLITEAMLSRPLTTKIDETELKIREIASFIEFNYTEVTDLGKILKKFSLSERTFYRYWEKITPLPPMKYINQLKMEKAGRLLTQTSLRVSEIAEKSGFEDPFYFSRKFREFSGKSPKKYRLQKYKNN